VRYLAVGLGVFEVGDSNLGGRSGGVRFNQRDTGEVIVGAALRLLKHSLGRQEARKGIARGLTCMLLRGRDARVCR